MCIANSLRPLTLATFTAAIISTPCGVAAAEKWGDIVGQITVKGTVEQGPPGSAVIDKKSGGLANVAVYLDVRSGDSTPIHPSYAALAQNKVKLTMRDDAFEPRLLLMRTTQSMFQVNQDSKAHNVNIQFIRNSPM